MQGQAWRWVAFVVEGAAQVSVKWVRVFVPVWAVWALEWFVVSVVLVFGQWLRVGWVVWVWVWQWRLLVVEARA
jgi:hypothetical protein